MSETKSKESQQQQNLIIIGGQYALKSCIYRGGTHNLYLAVNKQNPGIYFVVRLVMQLRANTNIDSIQEEEKLLKKLNVGIKMTFMPNVLASGDVRLHNINYYYQVFDKYGPSLKLCFQFANKNLTLGTICMIGIQMLNILEKMHGQFIVHRNLRPKKILTVPGKNEFVLIDFQQCVKFKHKNGKYIGLGSKFSNQTKLTKFSSLNQHLGLTASPKDDLESLGFILMYFLRNGDMFRVKETGSKSKQMEEQKLRMIPEKFCKDMPIEFLQYFQFVRLTNVQQYPLSDYEFLKKLFRNIFQQLNINEKEFQYDWVQSFGNCQLKKMNLQSQNQQQPKEDGQTKIVIHDPSNLEGIQEVQTELEKSSFKRDYYRKSSSLCINDEDDKQFESVSNKMLQLPNLYDVIKLKH
ncbi:unnamed protein product (macronuclear) [Paramecium tetraurelia]|uniref:Casein kinase I n=1 Tax=Paramecium tetraurelia TaxID=5888 RepID=A0E105_PARTE|nr:uncharacterized protein GSPATT00022141001 [Paramecium tetraurelia]CAK88972.1 unnamed protein product [Paramecium tetraurelia]|eukprot:XP_001456369.1 hypothetical protein (macronuclear) [Paramecium tetraurelia strain d4-2]